MAEADDMQALANALNLKFEDGVMPHWGWDPRNDDAAPIALASIAISLKRIADALNEPNEYGETGSAAVAGSIARGMRFNP